ncbi:unnamed protein product, partial [Brachionus calyciflorus]
KGTFDSYTFFNELLYNINEERQKTPKLELDEMCDNIHKYNLSCSNLYKLTEFFGIDDSIMLKKPLYNALAKSIDLNDTDLLIRSTINQIKE